jgi:hypothetical protein
LANERIDGRRRQQELDLRTARRPALALAKGYAAPEVGETIARAQGLAEQIDRPEQLVPLLRAQWVYHLIRCEPKQALSIAEQMEKSAPRTTMSRRDCRGPRKRGDMLLPRGVRCRPHAAGAVSSIGLRRIARAPEFTDPYATMLAHLACILASCTRRCRMTTWRSGLFGAAPVPAMASVGAR